MSVYIVGWSDKELYKTVNYITSTCLGIRPCARTDALCQRYWNINAAVRQNPKYYLNLLLHCQNRLYNHSASQVPYIQIMFDVMVQYIIIIIHATFNDNAVIWGSTLSLSFIPHLMTMLLYEGVHYPYHSHHINDNAVIWGSTLSVSFTPH